MKKESFLAWRYTFFFGSAIPWVVTENSLDARLLLDRLPWSVHAWPLISDNLSQQETVMTHTLRTKNGNMSCSLCTFLTGPSQIFWLDKEQKQDVLWLISSSFMFRHLNLSFILFYCLFVALTFEPYCFIPPLWFVSRPSSPFLLFQWSNIFLFGFSDFMLSQSTLLHCSLATFSQH